MSETGPDPSDPARGAPDDLELTPLDAEYLERARRIAHLGWGHVNPNPIVGCVLVRDGEVVGEGYHAQFGGPHAEIVALEAALTRAAGATAYVTLEPCNHHDKTPPCADALVKAGVTRVVYGAADPGAHSGGGGDALRSAGLDVTGPAWSQAASRVENPAFQHWARHGTPFVALKLAMSLDARIAAGPGERTRLTGADAEHEVHRLRSGHDAVLVGAGTLRADDPRLTVRLVAPGRVPPRRVVLAPDANIPPHAAVFEEARAIPVHVFCRTDASEAAMERLEAAGGHVHPVPGIAGSLDLDAVLGRCWEIGVRSILCEGGAALAASLLSERRCQRLYLLVAPITLGEGALGAFPPDAGSLEWSDFRPAGDPVRFGRDTMVILDRQEA